MSRCINIKYEVKICNIKVLCLYLEKRIIGHKFWSMQNENAVQK